MPGPASWGLTPRESTIVGALIRGRSNKEVAADLEISIHTAKAHIHRIFKKLGVKSRTELVYRLGQSPTADQKD